MSIVYSFSHGRQQCVSADRVQSDFLELFCGISQGTKTGRVLFFILRNKIATWHENRADFVYDLSLLTLQRLGSMISKDGMIRRLEADCEEKWLSINRKNSALMRVSFFKEEVPSQSDINVAIVNMKILGVTFNSKMSWMDHVNNSTKKAHIGLRNLVTIRRFGFGHFSLFNFCKLYILSVLEYTCPVWHPGLDKEQQNDLENVKKRAISEIIGPEFKNYDDTLKILGLERLDAMQH
ncbi:hypothetical protein QYM36_004181 [Artemia franciscana]|uniref:Uncharacterized protein n=1 Tax=Artemia franciscana TaxID=6661 RepID=A0AA88LBK7_ARTSF|nr:hypothetical protein QYM36_004181 [Artemia franciscana]